MPALPSPFPKSTDKLLRIGGPFVLFLTGFMFFRLRMYMEVPDHLILNQVLIASKKLKIFSWLLFRW